MKDINSKYTQNEFVDEIVHLLHNEKMLQSEHFLSDEDCLQHCCNLINAKIHDLRAKGCI